MRYNRINKRLESSLGFHKISEPFSGEPASAPLGERGRPGVQPRFPSSANKIGPAAPARLKIRDLNDAFRADIPEGKCIITTGVSELGMPFSTAAVAAARAFCEFTPDNDPDGEHDFGAFTIGEERLCWKIDYYDPTLRFGSRDPSDPAQTRRVLTIMLAEEF
jgi:hypothetical protein